MNSAPISAEAGPQYQGGPAGQAQSPSQQTPNQISPSQIPLSQQRGPAGSRPPQPSMTSVDQAIALREQAPEMYDLWLKIAKDKAATANYVERAPYEVPERLAQSGRPRALGALVIVLSFCGYLAWLGGPGLYIGGLIAILDLVVMFGMFFGLRPDRLPDPQETERPPPRRRLINYWAGGSHRAICPAQADRPRRGILGGAGQPRPAARTA
ncbi:MAG TPA: hypothetical protein VNW50_05105 [Streptosporangiaceae bacterium]|nr:hypothetical protein [Streptosporangiaceae bacterium]